MWFLCHILSFREGFRSSIKIFLDICVDLDLGLPSLMIIEPHSNISYSI